MSGASIEISDRALRPAEIRSASLNEAARTIDVIWSTGARVKRYDWAEGGFYWEELDMSPGAVDLGRLNAGASLLDSHLQGSMANRLGAVIPGSARLEGGKGIATVVLSTSKSGDQILADLKVGLTLPVSIGYRVSAYQRDEGTGDELPVLTATRWEPMEISAVGVPADPGAKARGEPSEPRIKVPVTSATRGEAAAGAMEFEMSETELASRAVEQERTRTSMISQIGLQHRAGAPLTQKALAEGFTVEQFREAIMDKNVREYDRNPTFLIAPQHGGHSDLPLAQALSEAISARLDRSFTPSEGSRAYVGLSAPEMARSALEARGEGTRGMSPNQLVQRALHTTSDFPTALLLAGSRQLARGYESAPSGLKLIAKKTTARDFRPKATIVLAGGGQLLKVNEHGEFKRASFVEGLEQYALSSFGRIFGITRQALVNDDLGVFADLPARFGRAANDFEANYLAEMLERNPKMGDALAVFHVSHANLAASGSALSVASLSAARLAMRQQTDANGDLVAIVPKYLIVPSALETIAEQLLATITPTSTADANPFAGKLELIVEPRLKNATAWYLSADPALFASVEFAHLEGEEGPQMDQRIGFDVDGTEFKVALDFGAAVTDFRGLYKNPGA
ncbi:phage head maturation protease [Devosia sp. UYZn731]|uniref:prohead protease/major capsid protein fusion protein n=1 Tax=Devosia sp. UYZn731 TaxID=3156345 RepID=UPI0033931E31